MTREELIVSLTNYISTDENLLNIIRLIALNSFQNMKTEELQLLYDNASGKDAK
jgi:hypothetical protein